MKGFYKYFKLNPALLFVISFFTLIALGTFLLLLPFSTYTNISFIDALFTSTSASCVTGLAVVNTSTTFTIWGQTFILLLIQLGGLGVLTFASSFSHFFKMGSSYENQIVLSNITNINKLGEVFKTLKYILGITLFLEAIGAFFIYSSLSKTLIPSLFDRVFFSIFHSISAFCNAGFSTLPQGVMEDGFVYNYPFQLSLIGLLVIGGLGFPVVINILKYIKHLFKVLLGKIKSEKDLYHPRILTLGTKINLITVAALIVVGTLFILINEYNDVLSAHQGVGKWVTALFTATSPRTAGFNSLNYNELHLSSVLVIIMLMWIGASPASTGGGIKTSTFAVAILNIVNLAQGKKAIELGRRKIADITISRAFATITLSLIVISLGILSISFFDTNLQLLDIVFECVSAYSTVGLSLGITADISSGSKLIVILLMFTGRITMLTVVIAFIKKVRTTSYRYPSEEILIN